MTLARDEQLDWFSALRDAVRVERVDGIPLLHIGAPGPIRAGLLFRVGSADEALPKRGITHLVEHLVLHGQSSPAEHRNGSTGTIITQFVVSGSEEQVVAFLNHVCEALRELPLERLEAERSILRVEAEGRRGSLDDGVLEVRYGAMGLGRGSYREFGAEHASAEELVEWARLWFVRGNAVAWITTEQVPDGLNLRLPEGERRAYVDSPGLIFARPAWFEGPAGMAVVEAVVSRSAAAVFFADVLTKSLFRQLRLERSYSYSALARYEVLDAELARICVFADSAADATAAMVGALADALSAMRDGHFDPMDVAAAREKGREELRHYATAPDHLLGLAAYDFLLGGAPLNLHEVSARYEATDETELAAVARAFWGDAIWQTPSAPDRADGLVKVAPRTGAILVGPSYRDAVTGKRVVVGEHGVSVTGDQTWTVPFADCVLAVQWGDGGRAMIGRDAVTVLIEPTVLSLFGEMELAGLDAAVPPDVVLRLPSRPAGAIPQPPARPRGLGTWATVIVIPVLLVAADTLALAVSNTLAVGDLDPFGRPITVGSVVALWAVALALTGSDAGLIWGIARRIRWARRQRKLTT